jgi:hypothetical protein
MMRKGMLMACAALGLAAVSLGSSPARAMATTAPLGLDGAIKAIDVTEQASYYGPYYRRPYSYRPYRPYAYRQYRPYAYRPYAYYRPYYRPIYRPYPVFVPRPVIAVPFPVPVVVSPWWGSPGYYW